MIRQNGFEEHHIMPPSVLINVLGHKFCSFRYKNCHPSFIFVYIFPTTFLCLSIYFSARVCHYVLCMFLEIIYIWMWLFGPSASLSPEFIHTSEVIRIPDFIPSILNTISFSFLLLLSLPFSSLSCLFIFPSYQFRSPTVF